MVLQGQDLPHMSAQQDQGPKDMNAMHAATNESQFSLSDLLDDTDETCNSDPDGCSSTDLTFEGFQDSTLVARKGTKRKNARQLRDGFCSSYLGQKFRPVAGHGTITITFYVKF